MTYEEFVNDLWSKVAECPSHWRKGQKVFNAVEEKYGIARDVQFKDGVDCFYDDSKISDFIYHSWLKIKHK